MRDIIAAQCIKRRRFPSLLSRAADYRAESVSIAKIKQKPAHIRRRRKLCLPRLNLSLIKLPKIKLGKLRYSRRAFTVSVVSLSAFIGLLLVLLVLSWRSDTGIYPGEDIVFKASLASYAGLSPAAAEQ